MASQISTGITGPLWKPEKRVKAKPKPIRTVGRKTAEYLKVGKKWIDKQPTDHRGWLQCAICFQYGPRNEMGIDHIETRSARPDLVCDTSNFRVAHNLCNVDRKLNG